MRILIFFGLVLAVLLLAWLRGRSDERWAAITCLVGALLTLATVPDLPVRFDHFQAITFAIDCGVLIAFVVIALRSDRFWPLWVAGLQLTTTVVHLLKLIAPDLMPFVFGAALAFWSYPILLLIGVGAWRTRMVERWPTEQRLPYSA